MGFLHFAPFSPWRTDIFYSANTGRGGFEIWLTDMISKYLFQSIMGGGRYGGGAGLMLAASGWTDRPDWHAVFVSEKWSVGLRGISGQIQPWCSARAWGGTVRVAGCQLSIAASTGTELVWFFFFFFLPEGSTLPHPSFSCFFNGGWQFIFSHSFSLSSLFSFCSAQRPSLQ